MATDGISQIFHGRVAVRVSKWGEARERRFSGMYWSPARTSLGVNMGGSNELTGPDLSEGIEANSLEPGGALLGHSDGDPVLLVRLGADYCAIGATCTHYGGPLAEGLFDGDTVRCPWHHACFNVRTGEALHAPALSPVACYATERRGTKVVVTGKFERDPLVPSGSAAVHTRSVDQERGDRRRGRGRQRRRGDASSLRTRGWNHDRRLGRRRAVRSPQSLEGLPRRERAGRMDSASPGGLLPRARHRAGARHASRASTPRASKSRSRAASLCPTTRCCSPPARSPSG